jgi:hypothetical protein
VASKIYNDQEGSSVFYNAMPNGPSLVASNDASLLTKMKDRSENIVISGMHEGNIADSSMSAKNIQAFQSVSNAPSSAVHW